MLHDPSHYEPPPLAEEIKLSPKDTDILRRLAAEVAQIAALPIHREKARLWQKLNDLESERPMVWINEIPWHEMDVDGELTLQTEHPWARDQERELRRTLYQWRHMPGDMIVNDFLACPLAIHSTDFGIIEDVDVVKTDDANDIVSRHFKIQIRDFADLEKIKMPTVTHNAAATEFRYRAMCEVYEGILPVKKSRADPHLVHSLGLPDPLVGHPGGDDRHDRAAGIGPCRSGADGRRLDGRIGPVRRAEPAVAGLQQHPHRFGRLRLHRPIAGRRLRSGRR